MKYDIVFFIDYSDRLSSSGFSHQMEFFTSLAYHIYVGVNDSHIAAVTSSGQYTAGEIMFNLTTYNNSGQVGSVLQLAQYSGIYSNYYFQYGFPRAHDEVLISQKRPNTQGVIIAVTTDYVLAYDSYTPSYITTARDNGTMVITVGVGVAANSTVTDPSLYFHVANASELPALAPYVAKILCGGKPS